MGKLRALAKKCGGRVVRKFTASVTHIVCGENNRTCRRTIKYLLGVLNGLWVVCFQWVLSSLKEKTFLQEEPFEVISDTVHSGAPKKARESTKKKRKIFRGFSFYLLGDFKPPSPSKKELQQLIKTGGGTVLTPKQIRKIREKENKTEQVMVLCDIILDEQDVKAARPLYEPIPLISSLWLMDSISFWSALDLSGFGMDWGTNFTCLANVLFPLFLELTCPCCIVVCFQPVSTFTS